MLCIPVRWRGTTIAVLSRESAPSVGRSPGELERTYGEIFNRFARMIAAGEFPFTAEDSESDEAPRVGDGCIVLDRSARVEYTSPNAISALHRMGIHQNLEGLRVSDLGLDDESIRTAFTHGRAGHRGGRLGHRLDHPAALHPAAGATAGCPARSCSCGTCPRCAAGTACCSRRTPRSARSTTG